jgi:hypothetical protein
MSDRLLNIVLAIAGVLVVAAIAVLGYDAYRAARTGPRWRRRLVGAGLMLLAALGIPGCSSAAEAPAGQSEPDSKGLAGSPEWKRIEPTWREADEVASGRRGPYPFDEAGQKKLLGALAAAVEDVDALLRRGILNDAEAGLLKQDLAQLTHGVQAKRPTELKMATCYKPMMYLPARDSMERLTARLPLLENLAASEKVHAAVARKVLASIERDIATLSDPKLLHTLPEADRPKAEEVRRAAADHAAKLKAALIEGKLFMAPPDGKAGAPVEASADWRAIHDAWDAALPLAKSGKSTEAQRKEAEAKLAAATKAAGRLTVKGILCRQEAELLTLETANIRQDIYRDPPTDSRVTCYIMMPYMPPAQQSYQRLAKRLPLVQKLIERGKVNPTAGSKVIAAIEADLTVLSDAKLLGQLQGAERQKAEAARDEMKAELTKLRKLLPPPPMCYLPPPPRPPKPQSRRFLNERLARVDALERDGKIRPAVAELVRQAIERDNAASEDLA